MRGGVTLCLLSFCCTNVLPTYIYYQCKHMDSLDDRFSIQLAAAVRAICMELPAWPWQWLVLLLCMLLWPIIYIQSCAGLFIPPHSKNQGILWARKAVSIRTVTFLGGNQLPSHHWMLLKIKFKTNLKVLPQLTYDKPWENWSQQDFEKNGRYFSRTLHILKDKIIIKW